jgi:hypothetical protein
MRQNAGQWGMTCVNIPLKSLQLTISDSGEAL